MVPSSKMAMALSSAPVAASVRPMFRCSVGIAGLRLRACSQALSAASTMPPDKYSEPSRNWAVASFGFRFTTSKSTSKDSARCGNTYVVGSFEASA